MPTSRSLYLILALWTTTISSSDAQSPFRRMRNLFNFDLMASSSEQQQQPHQRRQAKKQHQSTLRMRRSRGIFLDDEPEEQRKMVEELDFLSRLLETSSMSMDMPSSPTMPEQPSTPTAPARPSAPVTPPVVVPPPSSDPVSPPVTAPVTAPVTEPVMAPVTAPVTAPVAAPTPPDEELVNSCINSGGTVETAECCIGAKNFPNTCLIGVCGCGPGETAEITICVCPGSYCFDGVECVLTDNFPTAPIAGPPIPVVAPTVPVPAPVAPPNAPAPTVSVPAPVATPTTVTEPEVPTVKKSPPPVTAPVAAPTAPEVLPTSKASKAPKDKDSTSKVGDPTPAPKGTSKSGRTEPGNVSPTPKGSTTVTTPIPSSQNGLAVPNDLTKAPTVETSAPKGTDINTPASTTKNDNRQPEGVTIAPKGTTVKTPSPVFKDAGAQPDTTTVSPKGTTVKTPAPSQAPKSLTTETKAPTPKNVNVQPSGAAPVPKGTTVGTPAPTLKNAKAQPENVPSSAPGAVPAPAAKNSTLSTIAPSIFSSISLEGTAEPTIAPFNTSVTAPPPVIGNNSMDRSTFIETKCSMVESERTSKLLTLASGISSSNLLSLADSAQSKALKWITNVDDNMLCPQDVEVFKQRYTMAVVYHALGGPKWNACRAGTAGDNTPCVNNVRWLSAESECAWLGVECSDDQVITKLTLKGNGLSGELPPELFTMAGLLGLSLDHNQNIVGTLPEAIGNLKNLEYIELDDNNMSGTIPATLYTMTTLKAIDLNSNSFTGQISDKISSLAKLEVFQVEENQFTGQIPWFGLGALEKLLVLYLHENNFSRGSSLRAICDAVEDIRIDNPGYLQFFSSDCSSGNVTCPCCTQCF